MKNLSIIYWSGTGNTAEMARLISEGAKDAGAEVKLIEVGKATADDVTKADVIAFGSPSMGSEVIEEYEMEPFISSVESLVGGKTLGLFGSYGWGSGEWMVNWVDRMNSAGANVLGDGCIANDFPEGDTAEACKEYGKNLVQ